MSVWKLSKNGSDSQSGAEGSPKLTLKALAPSLKGGDTLLIEAGTYPEPINNQWPSNLIVKGLGQVIFRGSGAGGDCAWINNRSGIVADDICVDGSAAPYCGLRINGTVTGCRFNRWLTINCKLDGTYIGDPGCTGNIFAGFRGYNIGATTKDHGWYCRANNNILTDFEFWNVAGYAAHAYSEAHDLSNITITRGRAHDCRNGGVLTGCGGGFTFYNPKITEITVWKSTKGIELYGKGSGAVVEHNTCVVGNTALAFIRPASFGMAPGQPKANVFL